MLNLTDACYLAREYFRKTVGENGIQTIHETPKEWVFCSGKYGAREYGSLFIAISKQNGRIQLLKMPSDEAFQIMDVALSIEVPIDYRV